MTLVLASASPRRRELLARAGVAFEVLAAEIDESVRGGEDPRAYVARVAREKATAVHALRPGAWILAADTAVVLGADILGKAADDREAAAMIARLVGRTHLVMTGTCLAGPGGELAGACVETEVDMRPLGGAEIDAYVASGEWRGKAGAYAAQGIAAAFISAIRGSYTNVVGLPLAETIAALAQAGAATFDLSRGSPA